MGAAYEIHTEGIAKISEAEIEDEIFEKEENDYAFDAHPYSVLGMKKVKGLYQLMFILLLLSCEKEAGNGETLKNILIGEWVEVSPCESCNTLTFSTNGTIYLKYISDVTTYLFYYQTVSSNSIKVVRDWDIEENKKTTVHEVTFLTTDTLLLRQFMAVDYGITGFCTSSNESGLSYLKVKL